MITLSKIQEIYLKILKGLEPTFAAKVNAWRDAVSASGVIPYIYCGRRTPQEQEELYEQGRTKAGKIVTNARGFPVPQSYHCYGRAIDWVPARKVKGDGYEADWDNIQHYGIGIENGKLYQLQSLTWERPHLQDAFFKDWRDLANNETTSPKEEPVSQSYPKPSIRKSRPVGSFIRRLK